VNKPVYQVIENFYNEKELSLIWKELEFLTPKLLSAAETAASTNPDGTYKKHAKGLFLDHVYSDRNVSDILTCNRKAFNINFINQLIKKDIVYRNFMACNEDHTLINYYENNDYYNKHSDAGLLSTLTFFFKEPKSFTGGDLIFNDFNITIPIKNNMFIIFPSYYEHEVTKIKMKQKDIDKGLGRYSMAQFLNFKGLSHGTIR